MYNLVMGLLALICGIIIVTFGIFLSSEKIIKGNTRGKEAIDVCKYADVMRKMYLISGTVYILIGVLTLLKIITKDTFMLVFFVYFMFDRITNYAINRKMLKK